MNIYQWPHFFVICLKRWITNKARASNNRYLGRICCWSVCSVIFLSAFLMVIFPEAMMILKGDDYRQDSGLIQFWKAFLWHFHDIALPVIIGSGKRRWMIIDGRKSLDLVKSIRVRDASILVVSFLKSSVPKYWRISNISIRKCATRLHERWGEVPRSRLAGAGFKPP